MAGESLKVSAGNASGSSIPLEQELVIGRSTPGLGSLGGDSEISRVHARVYHDASGQLIVEDLGSTNGTFVNGNRISAATPLRAGDQLRVGQTTMSVEGGAAEGATSVGQVIPPAAVAAPPPPAATPPTQPFQPAAAQGPPPPPGGQQPGYAGGPVGGPPGRASGGSKAPWIALAAVVLIALIVGGLAIGGVFSSDDKKNTADTTTATTPAPATTTPPPTAAMPPPAAMPEPPSSPSSGNGWPPGIIPKLADRCAASGKLTRAQCTCTFTTLRGQYTFPEFVAALRKTKAGSPPAPVLAAIRKCLNS
jgi:predicted component of type VI protein secretion system